MSDHDPNPDRPALPRDMFRAQRGLDHGASANPLAVVVTPDYGDRATATASLAQEREDTRDRRVENSPPPHPPPTTRKHPSDRNPFDAYGERSSSRPYALRLPDPVDLVVRQIAAEERTHPLRIIDRILYDHLERIGRLPPPRGT